MLHNIDVKQPGEINVGVTGQQWEWRFTYPSYQVFALPDLKTPICRLGRM